MLFEKPNFELYLRELHRLSGLSIRPIQQELNNLLAVGLVKARKDGNRVYYSANTENPLFPEIRSLVEKTTGLHSILKTILTDPDIQIAFIFGSLAKGTDRPGSDLDLFVIGDLGLRKLTKLLSGASDRLGREINPHVMPTQEFSRKLHSKEHFVSSIVKSQKIFVIGDENDLSRLGKK